MSRPDQLISEVQRVFPKIWKDVDRVLAARKSFDLAEWCFLPSSASNAIVQNYKTGEEHSLQAYLARLVGMAIHWKFSRSTFIFDKDLEECLLDTKIDDKIPTSVLFHLPHWSVYIEFGIPFELEGFKYIGFFANLEQCSQNAKLLVLLCTEQPEQYLPVALDLVSESMKECQDYLMSYAINAADNGVVPYTREEIQEAVNGSYKKVSEVLQKILPYLIYLCSENMEAKPREKNASLIRSQPVKTKQGPKWFSPPASTWDVGKIIGEQLRRSQNAATVVGGTKSPHLRRAHWHSFRCGQGRADVKVKWLAPIFVGEIEESV